MKIRPLFALALIGVLLVAPSAWALFGASRTFQSTINIHPVISHPTGITPTTGSVFYMAPQGSPIATLSVAMSDGTAFNGSLSVSDGTGIVCGVSPCAVSNALVTARTMTGTDVGAHTLRLVASANGQTFTQPFTLTVTQPTITSLALSGTTFTAGSGGTVGTASVTVSVGSASPSWSIKTTGVDSATGATCNNYSFFSIGSSTGILTASASAPAQSYPGVCLQATMIATNSPYSRAFTLTGTGALSLVVTPAAPSIPSSDGTGGNVAALQGVWSDGSTFPAPPATGYIFVAPNYDVNGTYAVSGSELIIDPNGPGVGSVGGTVQHATMEAAQLAPTVDGVTSTPPSGPPLVNSAGYWSWSARQIGGGNVLYLNGQQNAPSDAATIIEVAHGGQFYANNPCCGWFVWNGTNFVTSTAP